MQYKGSAIGAQQNRENIAEMKKMIKNTLENECLCDQSAKIHDIFTALEDNIGKNQTLAIKVSLIDLYSAVQSDCFLKFPIEVTNGELSTIIELMSIKDEPSIVSVSLKILATIFQSNPSIPLFESNFLPLFHALFADSQPFSEDIFNLLNVLFNRSEKLKDQFSVKFLLSLHPSGSKARSQWLQSIYLRLKNGAENEDFEDIRSFLVSFAENHEVNFLCLTKFFSILSLCIENGIASAEFMIDSHLKGYTIASLSQIDLGVLGAAVIVIGDLSELGIFIEVEELDTMFESILTMGATQLLRATLWSLRLYPEHCLFFNEAFFERGYLEKLLEVRQDMGFLEQSSIDSFICLVLTNCNANFMEEAFEKVLFEPLFSLVEAGEENSAKSAIRALARMCGCLTNSSSDALLSKIAQRKRDCDWESIQCISDEMNFFRERLSTFE